MGFFCVLSLITITEWLTKWLTVVRFISHFIVLIRNLSKIYLKEYCTVMELIKMKNVNINLKIKQDISKDETSQYTDFLIEWSNPDLQFLEDNFDEFKLSKLDSIVNDVKIYEQDNSHIREMTWTISFEAELIDELKTLLEEQNVINNNEFNAFLFISFFAGNLEEIEVEDEENDFGVDYVQVNNTEVSGGIIFE